MSTSSSDVITVQERMKQQNVHLVAFVRHTIIINKVSKPITFLVPCWQEMNWVKSALFERTMLWHHDHRVSGLIFVTTCISTWVLAVAQNMCIWRKTTGSFVHWHLLFGQI